MTPIPLLPVDEYLYLEEDEVWNPDFIPYKGRDRNPPVRRRFDKHWNAVFCALSRLHPRVPVGCSTGSYCSVSAAEETLYKDTHINTAWNQLPSSLRWQEQRMREEIQEAAERARRALRSEDNPHVRRYFNLDLRAARELSKLYDLLVVSARRRISHQQDAEYKRKKAQERETAALRSLMVRAAESEQRAVDWAVQRHGAYMVDRMGLSRSDLIRIGALHGGVHVYTTEGKRRSFW